MSDPTNCSRCGAPLARAGEPCPRCLLELGRTAAPRVEGSPEGSAKDSATVSDGPRRTRRRAAPTVEELAKRFPELEVAARIGEGGMGAVYRARQVRIDRWVALKVLTLDPVDDPTFAERFRREAMVLARLDHPNVVKLYDFGERDGLFFLVLEYVDGPNLRALMKQGLLAPPQALAIVPQICEALQFAHDEGIVHRDIKPENVLLDAKGRVKIADFGLAKLVDADARDVSLTEVDQVVGTPHYMAPEQLRGSREVDHRADIYSLGVVFYEMLTGELPRGNFELPSRHIHVDVRLDEIVMKSLERTPERRYQHAVEVKTDVEIVSNDPDEGRSRASRDTASTRAKSAERRVEGAEARGLRLAIHPNRPWEFFVTYLLLWPLVGLAFNGGPWWFAGAMVLVAATFWSQIEHAIRARPALAEALGSESLARRSFRHGTGLAFLAVGLFTLFAGNVALFGNLSREYRSTPGSDATAMRGYGTGFLPLPASQDSSRTPLPSGTASDSAQASVWELDHEKLWNSAGLVPLAILLLATSAFMLTAKHTSSSARPSFGPAIAAASTLLLALALLEGSCLVVAPGASPSGPLVPVLDRELAFPKKPVALHGTEDLSRRLRIALLREDYQVTANGTWSMSGSGTPAPPREVQFLVADTPSPFDRWKLSWSGPRRIRPHAGFILMGRRDDGPVELYSALGDVQIDSALRSESAAWVRRILDEVRADAGGEAR